METYSREQVMELLLLHKFWIGNGEFNLKHNKYLVNKMQENTITWDNNIKQRTINFIDNINKLKGQSG